MMGDGIFDEIMSNVEEPTLSECLEFGQGDDDTVFELFEGVHLMLEGLYKVLNYGDDWWKSMNQSIWCDDMISAEAKKIDWDKLDDVLNRIFIIMAGAYMREEKFFSALKRLTDMGVGFRPQRRKRNGEM